MACAISMAQNLPGRRQAAGSERAVETALGEPGVLNILGKDRFSWPSQGSLTGYTVDETNAEWAQADFVRLLTGLLEAVAAQNIYVVGHSMGNRIIGRGMTTLASDRLAGDLIVFRDIVMIAPDIDADVFRLDIAPRMTRTGIHSTVYASSNDRALMASKAFHGYARAGDA